MAAFLEPDFESWVSGDISCLCRLKRADALLFDLSSATFGWQSRDGVEITSPREEDISNLNMADSMVNLLISRSCPDPFPLALTEVSDYPGICMSPYILGTLSVTDC